MQIAHTLTLPAANTGYSIATLLTTAGIPLPYSGRVSGIKIEMDSHDIFFVAEEGAYAHTSNVPDSYGYRLNSTKKSEFEASQHPANQISLGDIIVGSGTAEAKVHVWAYCV